MKATSDYLSAPINFGGEMTPRGEVIKTMQSEGHSQILIDRWMQGADHTQAMRERTKFRKQTIQTVSYENDKPIPIGVEASVISQWAVHKSLGSSSWVVTHIPTGLHFGVYFERQSQAKRFAVRLDSIKFPKLGDKFGECKTREWAKKTQRRYRRLVIRLHDECCAVRT